MKLLNTLLFTLIILFSNTYLFADLVTNKAVLSNDGSENLTAIATFPEPVKGDLYIATQINGEYIFYINEGSAFSTIPTPFRANSQFIEDIQVLDQPIKDMAPGHYPLFKIITRPETSPLDFNNWVGGIDGLSRINFSIGLSAEESNDIDGDGFPDDDMNRDGYRDLKASSLRGFSPETLSKTSLNFPSTYYIVKKVSGICKAFRVDNGVETFLISEGQQIGINSRTYTVGRENNQCWIYERIIIQIGGTIGDYLKKIGTEGQIIY